MPSWDAIISNNRYSSVTLSGQDSHAIKATSFKLAVPDNSQVTGIKVDVEKRSTHGINKDASVVLLKNGSRAGSDHADISSPWPTSDAYKSYGGSNDLWGTSWVPDEINGPGFGVAIAARNAPGSPPDTSYVDNIRMTAYYNLPRP